MGKYLTILFLFLCLTCMGQDMSKSKPIQKNDTLFLESNGEKYVVDKKHLVVKLKPSIKELDADIKQIDITKSGYRLIEVPNGTQELREIMKTWAMELIVTQMSVIA